MDGLIAIHGPYGFARGFRDCHRIYGSPDGELRWNVPAGGNLDDGKDAPEETLVVFREFAVDIPARLIRGDRILLDPAAAGVMVEVRTRVDRAIRGRDVQARAVRQGGERRASCKALSNNVELELVAHGRGRI